MLSNQLGDNHFVNSKYESRTFFASIHYVICCCDVNTFQLVFVSTSLHTSVCGVKVSLSKLE